MKALVPVRYAAWLCGQLGDSLEADMRAHVRRLLGEPAQITRLPRGFLVDAPGFPLGEVAEAASTAAQQIDEDTARRYPVFHHEMGPVWTGTIQCIVIGG